MNTRGFSLIEIIVAVGVFTVVAMLTVGSLFILTAAEKRVASIQANQDNVRFVIVEMTREIRNGSMYQTCGDPSCFSLEDSSGRIIEYKLSTIPKNDCAIDAIGNCVLRSIDGGTSHPITGSDVDIERLYFYPVGESTSDNIQARVAIVLEGIAKKDTPNETKIDVQTTISMLKIDK